MMDRAPKETGLSGERGGAAIRRPLRIDDLKEGEEGRIEATEAERSAIATMLDLADLARLTLTYRLRSFGNGRIGLTGRLEASVTQTCVVSLEPVPATLDVPIELEFWPLPLIQQHEASVVDPTSHPMLEWPEPIADRQIDLGPVIYESLATALDPYPRASGATFIWAQGGGTASDAAAPSEGGPFAALRRLKQP
jgi:hypothetical protein